MCLLLPAYSAVRFPELLIFPLREGAKTAFALLLRRDSWFFERGSWIANLLCTVRYFLLDFGRVLWYD